MAENLCYTAMNKFKEQWGVIPNVSDREYFTNSIHVPVWKEVSPFEKIDIESQLTGYSSAGCITYVELEGAVLNNIDALEQIVNYAMDKDIPYFALNVPNDLCLDCGYTGLIDDECPQCGGKSIQRLRRVTGYLTGDYTTAFNKGKQAEVRDRYKHSNKLLNLTKEQEENVLKQQKVSAEETAAAVKKIMMREPTKEEQEAINKYVRSISRITDINFFDEDGKVIYKLTNTPESYPIFKDELKEDNHE